MKRIGIITYHAPYNFGSTLQAYSTQEKLKDMGYEIEIVNYRMSPQKKAYSLVRVNAGAVNFIKDLLQLPILPQKVERQNRFEKFFSSHLNLTDEFEEPEKFLEYASSYDLMISGSDQIWNKESNELHGASWKYIMPYLLAGFKGKKISYASSIGNSTSEDLQFIAQYISAFSHVAMREESSAKKVSETVGCDVATVLDPTFLLTSREWCERLGISKKKNKKPYILFYSLTSSFKTLRRGSSLLKKIADNGYQVRFITPYCNYSWHDQHFVNVVSYGPIEFLNALYNAEAIVTDSFHGTIFSINMGKQFYSINGQNVSDFRKTDILEKLGLMSRSITWDTKYEELDQSDIDYASVNKKLEKLRQHSVDYLKNAIED